MNEPATVFSHDEKACPVCASTSVRQIGEPVRLPDGMYKLHECTKCKTRFETKQAAVAGAW